MTSSSSHTIFALASGSGRAGVSVFRVSGPDARELIRSITGKKEPKARQSSFRAFYTDQNQPIDAGLILWMPGPASFTGEDVAEFHTHGSPAVIEAMGKALMAAGARLAEPGEFTRRAFENGRMDLTEAEGLADLIDAETDGQREQALRQMQGGLRETYETWRSQLIDALAAIEGEIDFPDEEDVPDALSHKAYAPLNTAMTSMQAALDDSDRGERVRSGLDITIIGPPNAGKSTLLNRLAGRDAAIVSDTAGTTRDIIDIHMVISGLPVRLSDTAGIRQTHDMIEAEGVRRAEERSDTSDIRIGVVDSTDTTALSRITSQLRTGDFLLLNKSDQEAFDVSAPARASVFKVSALTGDGIQAFQKALEFTVRERFSVSQSAGLTRARHKDCTERAVAALRRAIDTLAVAPELSGDDVRTALHAIKELAGEADIEAVLDRIFSRFCIGK